MSSKIEVPMQLFQYALNAVEYLALRADDIGSSNVPVADAMRALLAAPVVERKPNQCGQCGASTTDICNQNGCGFLESGNGAPSELAELQATITRLTAELEELKHG